jgi:hypothetical protein
MTKTATVQAQQRWEYMEITRKTETYLINELNELGAAGWELVSASFHKETRAGAGAEQVWTAFLKRPQVGHAPSAPAREKAAVPAAAAANVNQPAKFMPSTDTGEEFDFADTPSDEEPVAEKPAVEE